MALTEAAKRAQKKYNEKTITIAASYKPGTDLKEGERIKAYLDQTGQSANSYIKALIKADLDNKGFMCDNVGYSDQAASTDDNKLPWEE